MFLAAHVHVQAPQHTSGATGPHAASLKKCMPTDACLLALRVHVPWPALQPALHEHEHGGTAATSTHSPTSTIHSPPTTVVGKTQLCVFKLVRREGGMS